MNAGGSKAIAVGERYRDNAIIAWARIPASGILSSAFGVESVVASTGIYTITLSAQAESASALVPIAIVEVDSPPTSAADARLVTVDQIAANQFAVYITDGSFTLRDNDFVFMVTGR